MNDYSYSRKRTGEWIRAFRVVAGYSQQSFADAAGIRRATISDIEHGKVAPSIETLCKLSSVLGVSVGDLVIVDEEGYDDIPL